jgi:hypothetical protein
MAGVAEVMDMSQFADWAHGLARNFEEADRGLFYWHITERTDASLDNVLTRVCSNRR